MLFVQNGAKSILWPSTPVNTCLWCFIL